MKIVVIVIVAYMLTGLRRIVKDIVASPLDQPAYVRRSSRFFPTAAIMLLAWLPTGLVMGLSYRRWDGFWGSVAIFVVLAMAGVYWLT